MLHVVLVVMLIATGVLSIVLSAQSRGSANRSAVAPQHEFVKRVVDEVYARFRSDTTGKNADYIPYLAQVDSKLFGVSVVNTDNQSYSVGDAGACDERTRRREGVRTRWIRAEGRPFNSVVAVVDMPSHAGNPLVNAGAIRDHKPYFRS